MDALEPSSEHAKALSSLGAVKGGKARAASMSASERSEAARRAVRARWQKTKDTGKTRSDLVRATHGDADHPLRIGTIEISCYVLEDGRRVISQRGLKSGLGFNPTGGVKRMLAFARSIGVTPGTANDLTARLANPIHFRTPNNVEAHGYEATILADICDAVLEARKQGKLNPQHRHIADQCEILVRGFATVGIIALVDEATGYQSQRARHALEQILEKFIAKELAKWAKMFPDEFYEQMFRLRGWKYDENGIKKRPGVVGHWTKDIVYARLAPGVLEELERKNPKTEKGYRKSRHHQWLTEDIGNPRLREHLAAVIALMRASGSWTMFKRLLDNAFPRPMETMHLFPELELDELEDLTGKAD